MQNQCRINSGFVNRWLVCGPVLGMPGMTVEAETQEMFESKMREALPNDDFQLPDQIALGLPFRRRLLVD